MLTIYRRHKKGCEHRADGREYRRCRCPIWVDGMIGGNELRRSLDLRDWEEAQKLAREWEAEGHVIEAEPTEITVEHAVQEFLQDAEARNLREPTLYKYRLLFERLKAFAALEGLRLIGQVDLAALRKFRASWNDAPISAVKKLERLRAFFRFVHETGWISQNPAPKLKNPKCSQPPTMPFDRDEMTKILAACNEYKDSYGRKGEANARRLRALVLLLRYTGMRIGDAVAISEDRIRGSRLFLYTAKTGVPVQCPLPDFVLYALEAFPKTAGHYFWSGESKLSTATGNWRRSLTTLFEVAKVQGGHAHRFRDTFAVELLLTGVPLERVSVLLGHSSLKVTEKHYSPWVRSRQEQLEADVRRSWGEDPIAFLAAKGTPEVHRKTEAVN